MKRVTRVFPLLASAVLTVTGALVPLACAQAGETKPDRWLHIRVDNVEAKGEMVRVNVPLELAEKVLPTINKGKLRNGKIRVEDATVNGVDLRGILEAARSGKDGEYVTIQGADADVRIFKKGGYFEAHVRKTKSADKAQVEVRLPMAVVDALLSAGNDELNLVAALRVLSTQGDTELVRLKDEKSTVRIWLDSKNTD